MFLLVSLMKRTTLFGDVDDIYINSIQQEVILFFFSNFKLLLHNDTTLYLTYDLINNCMYCLCKFKFKIKLNR